MKKAEHSFLTLTICVVAAMFIGLTVLACGKTTGTDLVQSAKNTYHQQHNDLRPDRSSFHL